MTGRDGVPASEAPKRLVLVATGNVSGGMMVDVVPSQPIEDPSQSWNALTVGGFTRKEQPPTPPPAVRPGCAREQPEPVQPRLANAPR